MSYRMYEFYHDYRVGMKKISSTEHKINLECITINIEAHDDSRLFDINLPKIAIQNLIGLLEELL